MDKLAPAIAWTKENGFWLANGLLLLLMVGLWYVVTGSLNEEKDDNLSKIKKETGLAQGVLQKKPADLAGVDARMHPNRSTQEGMKAELERTVDSIIEAWNYRVDLQKKLLVFPAVIENSKFEQVFAPYNPPETFPVEYADITIDALLSLYRVNIQDHMANICGDDGVRVNWDPEKFELDGDTPRRGGNSEYDDYDDGDGLSFSVEDEDASRFAVIWSEVNQQLWYDKLNQFQDRDDHAKESNDPTPLQCYMLQQDLWVLEAMFEVIRELNGDSTATDTSAIKQIAHIGIGREGAPEEVELHPVDARFEGKKEAADGDDMDPEMGMDDMMFDEMSAGGGGTGAAEFEKRFSEDEVVLDEMGMPMDPMMMDDMDDMGMEGLASMGKPPFHEMYVDTNFEPISSEHVLEVVNGEDLSETNLELLIAKRLPVRIGLKMDERKIPDFMAACINSPFSFEIQQVRINRHDPDGELIALGGSLTTTAYGSRDSMMDGDASESFDDVSSVEKRVNYDVDVEFFGIIKIYNPVRADLIRKAAGLEPVESTPADSPDSAATRDGSSGQRNAG